MEKILKFLEQLLPLVTFYPKWVQVIFISSFTLVLVSVLLFVVLYPSASAKKNATPSEQSHSQVSELSQQKLQTEINRLSKDQKELFNRLNERDQQTPDIEGSAAETYYRTANLFYVTNKYREAIDLYDKTINLRPDWFKPYQLKGMTLEKLGEWDKALEVYGLADQLAGPHHAFNLASSLLNLAHSNFAIGKYRETVFLCDRIMALVPIEDSPTYTQSAARLAATAYQKLGDEKKEAEYLKRFVLAADEASQERAAAQRRLAEIESK